MRNDEAISNLTPRFRNRLLHPPAAGFAMTIFDLYQQAVRLVTLLDNPITILILIRPHFEPNPIFSTNVYLAPARSSRLYCPSMDFQFEIFPGAA